MIKLKQILYENVTASQLHQIEKYLDKLWAHVGIDVEFTKHFLNRVNDIRNGKEISASEVVAVFNKEYKKYGKQISSLGDNAEAVMKDMNTNINIPFILNWNGKDFELVAKTIMRKKNFRTSNKKFMV